MRSDERVVDLMQRAGKLFAVAASPFLATNEATDLTAREMDLTANRPTVVRMFFYERNKNLMRERTGLSKSLIGTNDDVLFDHAGV